MDKVAVFSNFETETFADVHVSYVFFMKCFHTCDKVATNGTEADSAIHCSLSQLR